MYFLPLPVGILKRKSVSQKKYYLLLFTLYLIFILILNALYVLAISLFKIFKTISKAKLFIEKYSVLSNKTLDSKRQFITTKPRVLSLVLLF